jgi:hypothetical protein
MQRQILDYSDDTAKNKTQGTAAQRKPDTAKD